DEYSKSAELFYSLAQRDTAVRAVLVEASPMRQYDDGFYEEAVVSQGRVATATKARMLSEAFYYNDFPARARYYAGIAFAKSGQSQQAVKILTELSQNKDIVYSERANFYQGLVEFQNNRMYQAEALLEPLGLRRSP